MKNGKLQVSATEISKEELKNILGGSETKSKKVDLNDIMKDDLCPFAVCLVGGFDFCQTGTKFGGDSGLRASYPLDIKR